MPVPRYRFSASSAPAPEVIHARDVLQSCGALRPRSSSLLPGIGFVQDENGLAITGCGRGRLFRGEAAGALLHPLLPLLDGTHSNAQLADAIGAEVSSVEQALALLDRCGLLDEGVASPTPVERLLIRSTAGDPDTVPLAKAMIRALESTTVAVVGEHPLAPLIVDDLGSAGINIGSRHPTRNGPPDLRLVVMSASDWEEKWRTVQDDGAMTIPIVALEDSTLLGPLVRYGRWPCLNCAATLIAQEIAVPVKSTGRSASEALWAAGRISAELVTFIAGFHQSSVAQRLVRLPYSPAMALRTHDAYPRPGCRTCPASAADTAPDRYLMTIERRTLPFTVPRLQRPSAHGVPRAAKFYPSSPVLPLPAFTGRPMTDSRGITVDQLGAVLAITAGYWDRGLQRITPSGGDRGSTQVHVLTSLSSAECHSGYYYDGIRHCLIPVRASAPPLPTASRGLALVLSVALPLLEETYEDFRLQLGLLDAGCALANLRLAVAMVGLEMVVRHEWDPAIAETCDLSLDLEPIAAVVVLTGDTDALTK